MADYGVDEFGFPLTPIQGLRRLQGFRPNDGSPGVNHEPGDNAVLPEYPPRPSMRITDAEIEAAVAEINRRNDRYVEKWRGRNVSKTERV